MKRFLLLSLSVIAINACTSIQDAFYGTELAQQPVKNAALSVEEIIEANEVEMAEMERLTGQTIRFDNITPPKPEISKAPEIEIASIESEPSETAPESITEKEATKESPEKTNVHDKDVEAKAKIETTKTEAVKSKAPIEKADVQKTSVPQKQEELAKTSIPVKQAEKNTSTEVSKVKTTDVKTTEAKTAEKVAIERKAASSQVVQKRSNRIATTITKIKNCPTVEILPLARSLTLLEGDGYNNLIARGVVDDVRGGCKQVNGGIEVNLDILMTGKIGTKGRFEGDQESESFVTFPYFVAVSDANGNPVDKKIMATAMRFKPIINDLKHAEKITQFIPIENMNNADDYRILIGYQLNREQLNYNRASTVSNINNQRKAPDLKNQPRRSLNPLAD